jgi:hypothetical protein
MSIEATHNTVLTDVGGQNYQAQIPVNIKVINVAHQVQRDTTIELLNNTLSHLGRVVDTVI